MKKFIIHCYSDVTPKIPEKFAVYANSEFELKRLAEDLSEEMFLAGCPYNYRIQRMWGELPENELTEDMIDEAMESYYEYYSYGIQEINDNDKESVDEFIELIKNGREIKNTITQVK